MKKTLLILGLSSLVTPLLAECPKLKDVIPVLPTIAKQLKNESQEPITIAGKLHTIQYGENPFAVDNILAGVFKGHSIHRYEEADPGACEYLLTDDNTPAQGSFYLKHKPLKHKSVK